MLNKQSGNMYKFLSHTWNPIRGECPHFCKYCFVKKMAERYGKKESPLFLHTDCFTDKLEKASFIFVGSSTDMFAEAVPTEWITRVFEYIESYNALFRTPCLFQTKNPKRYKEFMDYFVPVDMVACTFESNRPHAVSKAPAIEERFQHFKQAFPCRKMVTIEPILDFDCLEFMAMICEMKPDQISIGADSKGCGLPEPSREKVKWLLENLEKIFTVIRKDNLGRLLL